MFLDKFTSPKRIEQAIFVWVVFAIFNVFPAHGYGSLCDPSHSLTSHEEQMGVLKEAQAIPDLVVRYRTLYQCYKRFGKHELAANALIELRKLEPEIEYINYFIAQSFYDAGRLDSAYEAIEAACDRYESDIDVYLLKGKILTRDNELERAIEVYDKFNEYLGGRDPIQLSPDNVRLSPAEEEFYSEYYALKNKVGNFSGAKQVLIDGLRRNPGSKALFEMAVEQSKNMTIAGHKEEINLSAYCSNILVKSSSYCK